jgi:hypothetical protein
MSRGFASQWACEIYWGANGQLHLALLLSVGYCPWAAEEKNEF